MIQQQNLIQKINQLMEKITQNDSNMIVLHEDIQQQMHMINLLIENIDESNQEVKGCLTKLSQHYFYLIESCQQQLAQLKKSVSNVYKTNYYLN